MSFLDGTEAALRPPRRLDLATWADAHFYLSPESAAEPGRWRTLPYQVGILQALGDPAVRMVVWQKSARVGATKLMTVHLAYHIVEDPCPMLLVEPTVEDAQGFSREELAPMIRDCPAVAARLGEPSARTSEHTLLSKSFPGGVLTLIGANSPRGFRRVSRRVIDFDEVDGYPPSAGVEGDQIKLGIARTLYYWNPKIFAASTPTIAGVSRIEGMYEAGDRRRYHVPCPSCGYMDVLTFREQNDRGHFMQWPPDAPGAAYFVCRANGCVIEHKDKAAMVAAGEWRAEGEFNGTASFHLWAAYSLAPQATWGQIAQEFVEANRGGPEKLKTFVNITLGETWQDRGDAPDWERLHDRRESYPIGTVPAGVVRVTAGVDVQRDRFVAEVVGWSETKESWSIDAFVIPGDTSDWRTWSALDDVLARRFLRADGGEAAIDLLGIDSGFNTQEVYNWSRKYKGTGRVAVLKGVGGERRLIGTPATVDVTATGRAARRGARVWPIGVAIAKAELYGWLRLARGAGAPPPGYCHFPEYDEGFFRQLTAEHLVTVTRRNGAVVREWHVLPNRENHYLDCRIYARAAASILGLDRATPAAPAPSPALSSSAPPAAPRRDMSSERAAPRPGSGGWVTGGRPRGGGWIGGGRRRR